MLANDPVTQARIDLTTALRAAVRHGLITIGEACARYHLSIEAYLCWHRCFATQ